MYYTDITIFEINHRIEFLQAERDRVISYFNSLKPRNAFDESDREDKKSQKIRQEINFNLNKTRKFVLETNVSTHIFYSPPPAVGGLQGNIDLFENMFSLERFQISPQTLTDCIDKSIGIYANNRRKAIIRTFNPLWWIWKFVKTIVSFPFYLIQEAGFNSTKMENSFVGKVYKFISSIIIVLASAIVVLNAFGYQDKFVDFVKNIFNL